MCLVKAEGAAVNDEAHAEMKLSSSHKPTNMLQESRLAIKGVRITSSLASIALYWTTAWQAEVRTLRRTQRIVSSTSNGLSPVHGPNFAQPQRIHNHEQKRTHVSLRTPLHTETQTRARTYTHTHIHTHRQRECHRRSQNRDQRHANLAEGKI